MVSGLRLLLVLALGAGRGVAGAGAEAPLALDPQIRQGRLENGLTYYIRQNRKPENRAALRLAVNAGSVLEEDDQQGLAHFIEHMAFNGTRHFEKQELVDFLESIGMRFGPELNAFTSFDETVYLLEIPLDDPAVVEKAFLVLEDWASGLLLDAEEIEKERGVIKEEWRLGRGAEQRVSDKQIPVLLHQSRYAERLPIGKLEVIEKAPREAFTRFYQRWYRPNLMAVVAVGDFDADRIEGMIRAHFSGLRNPEGAPARPLVPVPDHEATLFGIATDPELASSAVQIVYKREAREERTEADYRRSMVEQLGAALFNVRLSEKLQQADPPYMGAAMGQMAVARTKDLLVQMAVVREGALRRGLSELLVEARRVNRDGFTTAELDRVKAQTLRGYEQAYNERDKTESATHADECVRHFLEAEPAPGIAKELEMARRFLGEIGVDEVNREVRQWVTATNRVVLYSAPEKAGLAVPTREEILAMVSAAEKAEVAAYDDGASDAPLMARVPEPGRVVAEKSIERIGLTEWKLANGVRVLLKPTDFKNDQVLLRGFSPGGHSLVPDEAFVPASTANMVVEQSGVGEFNLVQLQKKLSGKIARVSTHLDEQFEGVSGFASPTDLETMFQLLHLRFTAPRADEEMFRSLQARLRESIRNRENEPEAVFADAVTKMFYRDHPRHQPLTLDLVERMRREESLRIYRERFGDAGDFTVVLVGNFRPDEIRPLVERYVGSLPAAGRRERGRFCDDDPLRGRQELTVRKGIEPKCAVRIWFTGDAEWRDEDRYRLRAAVDVLQIRLREELREDLGGVYGVGISGGIERWPKGAYQCGIQFGCDPARAEDLIQVALKEVRSLQEDGPSEVNLAKVKEQHLRQFEVDVKENAFWLNNLVFRAQHELPLAELLDFPEKPKRLTADAVRQAARVYFASNNVFLARLLPEPKPAAPE